jgi:hypothetical protein
MRRRGELSDNGRLMRLMRTWRPLAAVAIVAVGLACAPSDSGASADAPAAAADQTPIIDHLAPRRDSVGGVPTHFEWTRIDKADSYLIGVWNDVDLLVWRVRDIPENRIAWPKGEPLEPGTYFWSVTAFRGGEPVAESGRAAFVVRTDPLR